MRSMGRATGVFSRTGSGTTAQTSGCGCKIKGMRSTVAASALSPRSARPCSMSVAGSASCAMRWQVWHWPQKSSSRRSQLAACANMRASVNFPTPRGPVKSSAWGTRCVLSAPCSACTMRGLPRNSAKPISQASWKRRLRQHRFDDLQNLLGDFVRRAHGTAQGIETLNADPRRVSRKRIVNFGGVRKVVQAGLLQIVGGGSVIAGSLLLDHFLGFRRRHAEIQDQLFARQAVDGIFHVADPIEKFRAFLRHATRALMRKIGAHVSVGKNNLAIAQRGFQFGFGFQTVAGVEQCSEAWVDLLERAKLAVQELPHKFAEARIVFREPGLVHGVAALAQRARQEFHLRAFAAAVDALDGDEFPERGGFPWRGAHES